MRQAGALALPTCDQGNSEIDTDPRRFRAKKRDRVRVGRGAKHNRCNLKETPWLCGFLKSTQIHTQQKFSCAFSAHSTVHYYFLKKIRAPLAYIVFCLLMSIPSLFFISANTYQTTVFARLRRANQTLPYNKTSMPLPCIVF